MAASTLAPDYLISLPSEVLLTIFGAQESFQDIRSLFSTCRSFYALWQTHASSISNHLLTLLTPCYTEVKALVTADETAHACIRPRANLLLLPMDPRLEMGYQSALNRITSTRRFARQARHLCNIIESRYLQQKQNCHDVICRSHPMTLFPQERIEITKAHHFIKLFAISFSNHELLATHKQCEDALLQMPQEEKHMLYQVVRVMHDFALPWDKLGLGIGMPGFMGAVVGLDACCCGSWTQRFEALKTLTDTTVRGCGECLWDDTGRFARMGLGHGGAS